MKIVRKSILFLIAIFLNVQLIQAQGVKFEQNHALDELLTKAKNEKKFLMIDCYATWCVPCKKMEKEVFANAEVGNFVNKHFISARIQMDKTKNDDPETKSLYKTAELLEKKYTIGSYPTILFLSPNGELVNRTGFQEIKEFLNITQTAVDPSRNMLGLFNLFIEHKLDGPEIAKLSMTLKNAGEKEKALEVATYYKEKYLDLFPVDSLFNYDRLFFVYSFPNVVNSRDRFFHIFSNYASKTDSVMKTPLFARSFADFVITNEEVDARIRKKDLPASFAPDWNEIAKVINERYGSQIAARVVLQAKFVWYNEKEDWPNVIRYFVQKMERENLDSPEMGYDYINGCIYELIVEKKSDQISINKAIFWMEKLLSKRPDDYHWIDTYASLLYKAGRKDEAIESEKKALLLSNEQNDQKNIAFLENTITRMKKGEKIW